MRVEKITAHELDFDQNALDSDGKAFRLSRHSIAIPGSDASMDYVLAKPQSGDESYYYPERLLKDQIVLHYTMGYLKGDMATLTRSNYHVSVPFVIGRNGTIYNLFSSSYWSYHLGKGAIGGNKVRSQKTIGIELSTIGPLKKQGDSLSTNYSSSDIYCDMAQTEYFQQAAFRDFDYYATFTEAQYKSLIVLLDYLTSKFNIERTFLPEPDRYKTLDSVVDFGGIVSHVNYRATGKTDIGPAFDWQRLIQSLQL